MGVVRLEMEGGDLPLRKIIDSWTIAVQGRGHVKWLPSPSHLRKLSSKRKRQKKEPDPSAKQEA